MANAGAITVAVRVRPPNAWEVARLPDTHHDLGMRTDGAFSTPANTVFGSSCLREVVKVIDDRILMFDPEEKDKVRAFAERGFVPPGTKRYKDKRFMFDRVFDTGARQIEVYEATTRPLLDGLLDGYNATVFAYGATGCGKTHTISGTDADPGIIYLTMADLFDKIEEKRSEYNIDISVTFLEIYNEEIRDLLADSETPTPRGGLQIREDKSVKVVGLVELHPKSAEQIKEIVLLGNSRRTQSPTHANETSSRSHAVLQVHVSQSPRTASTTEQRAMATLSIIDLAGSERAAATTNMGKRMVEGANINKSLLALGNCINALCESAGATRHVPYRNSKLTRLLKFSLGGNCKTVMIVCVAPTSNHFDDTHNTLLYADRASKIKTKVVTRNVVNVERHVGQYVEAINRLNLEVAELKAKLAGKLSGEVEIARRRREEAKAEVERARQDMRQKATQAQSIIVDGGMCEGRIAVSRIKQRIFEERLDQLRERPESSSSADVLAEQAMLAALTSSEVPSLEPSSDLHSQLARSHNATSMFDAMLCAVTERRSSRLEDVDTENLRLESQYLRSEMTRKKGEAMQEALRLAITSQVDLTMHLLGMLSRCTITLKDECSALHDIRHASSEGVAQSLGDIASSLERLAQSNDVALSTIVGGSINTAQEGRSLRSFTGYKFDSAVPIKSAQTQAKTRVTRRISSGLANSAATPNRRTHRTPRKSLRSSIAINSLYGRRSATDKLAEKKKGVQWKDEAGKGSLDDRSFTPTTSTNSIRSDSPRISEGDWEDERTEDSASSSVIISTSGVQTNQIPRRISRLDPSFLTSRSGSSSLSSLPERDETGLGNAGVPSKPFSDRSNHSHEGTAEESNMDDLHVAKGNGKESPSLPSTFTAPGSIGKRRRSHIGPVRSEKIRRRSSLIPSPSSERDRENENTPDPSKNKLQPQRIATSRTPSKRPKRMSLLGSAARSGPLARSSYLRGNFSNSEANSSSESYSKAPRPSWR